MPAKAAETLLKKATINNTLVDVKIPDLSWSGKALVREVQTHPWKQTELYHISFFSVAAQDTLDVVVPLEFVGEAAGVKEDGGVLEPVITELQVQTAPDNIPESIQVDVSQMHAGDAIRVEELNLPEGVTTMIEPEETVATIAAPLSVTEEEALEAELLEADIAEAVAQDSDKEEATE